MNQKIKIMKPPSQLTDDEIRSYMDFDSVLKKQRKVGARRIAQRWAFGAGSLALIIIIAGWMLSGEPAISTQESRPANDESKNENVLPDTVGANESKNSDTPVASTEKIPSGSIVDSSTKKVDGRKIQPRESNRHPAAVQQKRDTLNEKHSTTNDVYHQAEPVDGYQTLYEYFNKNLKYPQEVISDSLQETVTVTFVITTSGAPDMITVDDAVAEPFKREVENLVRNMPSWKAATLNGKPVPSRITLPLTFKIEKITK